MTNHEKFPSMQRFSNKGNESGFYNIMALFLTLASCCSLSFFNDKAELPVDAVGVALGLKTLSTIFQSLL